MAVPGNITSLSDEDIIGFIRSLPDAAGGGDGRRTLVVACDRRREGASVLGDADAGLGGVRRVRVHEVEPRPIGDPLRVRVRALPGDLVPSDVRHLDVVGEAPRTSGQDPEPGLRVLLAPFVEHLHTHADSEDPLAGSDGLGDRAVETLLTDGAHAVPEVTDPGDHEGRRRGDPSRIARHDRFAACMCERAGDRVEVPAAVVEHGDPGHGRYSVPFVLGTPPRSVGAQASPRAFASALNSASTT